MRPPIRWVLAPFVQRGKVFLGDVLVAQRLIEANADGILLRREDPDAALARLRRGLSGYSVDQFLHERRADWGE